MSSPSIEPPRLETERLQIRPFTLQDLAAFHALVRDPRVTAFLPEEPMSREEAREVLAWLIDSYAVNTVARIRKLTLGVVLRASREIVGWAGFGPVDFAPERTELYYGLAPEHWGRGLGTEMARAVLAYGFQTLQLDPLFGIVNPANHASRKILERLGMTFEKVVHGLPPEHASYEGDRLYHIRRADWQARQPGGPS